MINNLFRSPVTTTTTNQQRIHHIKYKHDFYLIYSIFFFIYFFKATITDTLGGCECRWFVTSQQVPLKLLEHFHNNQKVHVRL